MASKRQRRDDEASLGLLAGLHGLPTMEAGIGPGEDLRDALGQSGENTGQMACDLPACRSIAITQLAPDIFSRLSQKGQNGLIALLTLVFRVITLAGAPIGRP